MTEQVKKPRLEGADLAFFHRVKEAVKCAQAEGMEGDLAAAGLIASGIRILADIYDGDVVLVTKELFDIANLATKNLKRTGVIK